MPENEKTRLQKFMGGGKQGYQIAFQMAWPAVMESFFIALAGMVDHERIRICPGGETSR